MDGRLFGLNQRGQNLCAMSATEKYWMARKCHLNITRVMGVIKLINNIGVHALISHLFAQLCEEMGAEPIRGIEMARLFGYKRSSRDFF